MVDRHGWIGAPDIFNLRVDADADMKMAHDSYSVYVNNHFVGEKTLLAQNETINDVEKYLRKHGYDNFSFHVDGNQLKIQTANSIQARKINSTLSTYLQIR